MGDKTAIEWTDASWNPSTGCNQISPGCDNCYALTLAKRLKAMGSARYQNDGDPATSGPGFALTVHTDALDIPLRWTRPRRIFVNSMSDLFHRDVPLSFINQVWDVMARCPQHTFQILTKRSKRMRQLLAGEQHGMNLIPWIGGNDPLPNVWLGVSIENDSYTWRADHLRNTPAIIRFLSLEPLLGPLPSLDLTGIDWVIMGGESGPSARPMHPDWARDIRDQCIGTGTPFFFKQWGEWAPSGWGGGTARNPQLSRHRFQHETRTFAADGTTYDPRGGPQLDMAHLIHVGKKTAGRELDGRTWDQSPQSKATP